MKFIRPYGQSVTDITPERKIVVNGELKNNASDKDNNSIDAKEEIKRLQSINEHFKNQQKIYLSAVISTLDKIILKPAQGKKCPDNIHKARQNIADALWEKLKDEKLKGITKEVWQRRIEPYEIDKKDGDKKYYGRWFRRFCGADADINNLDNDKIADKIIEHLFDHEYRFFIKEDADLDKDLKYEKGRLDRIANTISSNHLRKNLEKKETIKATQNDITIYCYTKSGCLIEFLFKLYKEDKETLKKYIEKSKEYYKKCKAGQKGNKPDKVKLKFSDTNILNKFKERYETLFKNEKIVNLIKTIHKNNNVFLAHEAVRDFYIALLRSYKAKVNKFYESCQKQKGNVPEFNIDNNIPKDVKGLLKKLKLKEDNKDINAQIRLGKIIHYTNVCLTNTDAIKDSHFWTSTGQIEIKRSEAFVKSWFNFITFANHSLRYLSDEKEIGDNDIVGKSEENLKITLCPQYPDKIKFILGNNHGFDNYYDYLHEIALKKLNRLRNMVFHFHSREAFLEKLQSDIEINDTYFKKALNNFVQTDLDKHYDTLWESLCGVGIKEYMHSKEDIQAYWNCVTSSLRQAQGTVTEPVRVSVINLPKFITVLKRADNTRCKIITPPTVAEDNKGEKQCQYTMLKNLYERPFKAWFSNASMPQLTAWIDAVKEHTKEASKKFKENEGLSIAMEDMPNQFNSLSDYLDELIRLETQKGSVQNGYASDKTAQNKKSNAVENFKMDVIIRAFDDFLKAHDMDYLKKGLAGTKEINFKPNNQTKDNFKPWQQELYLLLHFVPVGIACDLEHQLTKYFTVRKNSQIQSNNVTDIIIEHELYAVFELYRNNNDNKFEGAGEKHPENITEFYKNISDYQNIFERNKSFDAQKAQAQHRHVREMVRFGISDYLKKFKVTHESVEKWQQFDEKEIEQKQKAKSKLHDDWVKNKKLSDTDTEKYKNLVTELSEYNTLDNHVRLVNFRKIHKLVMQILGRLVGYSFMYERDLYFITLAHLYDKGEALEEFFKATSLNKFNDGNIRAALGDKINKAKKDNKINEIQLLHELLKLAEYDTGAKNEKGHAIKDNIRNNFAHFNMLRKNDNFNITDYINKARDLMAYDRKLKNAVVKSIKTIFEKEGIDINFSCNDNHDLKNPKVDTQTIYHLGGDKDISEPKHYPNIQKNT